MSARYARDPVPAAPAASTGHGPRPVPSFSSRCLRDGPVLRLAGRRSRTRCKTPPEPAKRCGLPAVYPPRSGRVRRSRGVGPEGGRRGGHFLPPPGSALFLTPRIRARPVPVPPPGAMAAEATDAGTAPSADPPGQPPGGPPKDAAGSPKGSPRQRRGQVAANEHKIGTLSRHGSVDTPSLARKGLEIHTRGPDTPVQTRAWVPSPVRERDRVRVGKFPEETDPIGALMVRSVLKVLVPHPNPLPHGRGSSSRFLANVGAQP